MLGPQEPSGPIIGKLLNIRVLDMFLDMSAHFRQMLFVIFLVIFKLIVYWLLKFIKFLA